LGGGFSVGGGFWGGGVDRQKDRQILDKVRLGLGEKEIRRHRNKETELTKILSKAG
jgi:hypothetical protein